MGAAPEWAEGDKSKAPIRTRIEALKGEHGEDYSPQMPPVDCGAHVLDHFWLVGPTLGDSALDNVELAKYQQNQGIELSPWECATLIRMSREYMSESHHATKRDRKAPWQSDDSTIDRVLTERDRRDAMRALAAL